MSGPRRRAPVILVALAGLVAAAVVVLGVGAAATPGGTAEPKPAGTAFAIPAGTAVPVVVPAMTVDVTPAAAVVPPATSARPPATRSGKSKPAAVPTTATSASSRPTPAATGATARAGTETETVVLAGGCFWGVQGVYEHVRGVTTAESGYTGGTRDTANYETVSTGTTGHAESVRITFDPAQVSYEQILQIFFSVVHDPTELDRQGPDTGTQYRSEIFAQDQVQKWVATSYIAQLTGNAVFAEPIVTKVEVDTDFYPAEKYHQDFLDSHPSYPYIATNDIPKVRELERLFPRLYRTDPVLYLAAKR